MAQSSGTFTRSESASNAIICVKGVGKRYPGSADGPVQEVLRGVSLEVSRGEFVALMGASGSGKTTLLNLIGGIDRPDSGTIHLDGVALQELGENERSDFRLRKIGFVFQFFNLLPHLSVIENVSLPLLFLNRNPKESRAAAAEICSQVQLVDKFDRPIHKLSGGEMQRVAIARALVHRPAAILADEPTGNLDSETGGTILELLRDVVVLNGQTLLMATHDPQAGAMADRVVRMQDGRIIGG